MFLIQHGRHLTKLGRTFKYAISYIYLKTRSRRVVCYPTMILYFFGLKLRLKCTLEDDSSYTNLRINFQPSIL